MSNSKSFLSIFAGKRIAAITVVLCLVPACAAYSQPLNNSKAAADDAARRLEEALGGANQNAVQATRGGTRPRWINSPSSDYPQSRYIAAVGTAKSRADAERQAFAGITAFFGQVVKHDYAVAAVYSEAVTNGIVSVSENTNVRETIVTAASLDRLIGAAVGGVWEDESGTVYALAYLEKERTVFIYTELVRINRRNIENLVSMNADQKNTFDGYARYRLAALLAGINAVYANIVLLAGGSTASPDLTSADTYVFEAAGIIRNIAVGFDVKNDSGNRVRDAFAKVINGEGLRTRGNNPPYVLEINIDTDEARFPGNNFIFCRYTLSANLVEKATGSVILPFNVTDREGHTTYAEARNRAFISMEKAINEKYPDAFRKYLAALLPEE
ncbi:MAG: LPP20 family lipoprotein [Treponema sp.]|jgi:hypothetical protein|nr:LPP20 family lipoprotein [Treponema sp.]